MSVEILIGDCREMLRSLPADSIHCVVTSPPYFGLRDYGVDRQIGIEPTPAEFVTAMVEVFREVRRVLRVDGTLWLNLGDSYAGSCRGGNPEAGTKQGTNKGSQSVGVLYGLNADDAASERARMKTQNAALRGAGLKPKDLIGIPWRVAFALQEDGWYLRSDIIWHKPNPMPESVTDRPTSAHEHVFLLSKSEKYFYDAEAIREKSVMKPQRRVSEQNASKGRHAVDAWKEPRILRSELARDGGDFKNSRNVWTIATRPFPEAHFATFPPELPERCIKAGCPDGGTVLDPFGGAGTTGLVAQRLNRNAVLIELNPEYAGMARRRIDLDRAGPVDRLVGKGKIKPTDAGPLFGDAA